MNLEHPSVDRPAIRPTKVVPASAGFAFAHWECTGGRNPAA